MRAKLKRLRLEQGHTMKALAKKAGISLSRYSQVEAGDKAPSLRLALRIKRALDYYGDDIFDNTAWQRRFVLLNFVPKQDKAEWHGAENSRYTSKHPYPQFLSYHRGRWK